MKRAKGFLLIALLMLFILFVPTAIYITLPKDTRLIVNVLMEFTASLVEVPLCYSGIANDLGIESGEVRNYVIESLSYGMMPTEVEATLRQIAPISILDTHIVNSTQNTYVSIRVHLCKNPFGDVVLDLYYSKEEDLLVRFEDAWAD